MAYDKRLLERFSMEGEKQTDGPGASVHIPTICSTLAISESIGKRLALYLKDLGWARMEYAEQNSFVITPFGYEEIEKMHWPFWRRWMNKKLPIVISVIALIISGITPLAKLFESPPSPIIIQPPQVTVQPAPVVVHFDKDGSVKKESSKK